MKIELNESDLDVIVSSLYQISRTDQVCDALRKKMMGYYVTLMFPPQCKWLEKHDSTLLCKNPVTTGECSGKCEYFMRGGKSALREDK